VLNPLIHELKLPVLRKVKTELENGPDGLTMIVPGPGVRALVSNHKVAPPFTIKVPGQNEKSGTYAELRFTVMAEVDALGSSLKEHHCVEHCATPVATDPQAVGDPPVQVVVVGKLLASVVRMIE
jgi:hypothetical protein